MLTVLIVLFYMTSGPDKIKLKKVDLKQLLLASIESARRGGDEVVAVHKLHNLHEFVKGKTKEGAKEMRTDGDLRSQAAMTYGIKMLFPRIKVVSEEKEEFDRKSLHLQPLPNEFLPELSAIESSEVNADEVVIWIDPLDATQEYTENLIEFVTTMVCVVVKGVPVIGVIHRPFLNETLWGYVGYGHSANLEPDPRPAAGKRIIVSRSHAGQVEAVAKDAFGADSTVIPAGGSGYKTLQVVKGEADAYVHVTLIKKWDICAGDAILRSVGGHMTTIDGHDIDYAASGGVANEYGLVASLRNHDDYLHALSKLQLVTKAH